MISSVYSHAYPSYVSLPVLGPVIDEFDDWLIEAGYTWHTRQLYLNDARRIAMYLRYERGRHTLGELRLEDLPSCWAVWHEHKVPAARTAHHLQSFLQGQGILPSPVLEEPGPFDAYLKPYGEHLRRVRALAPKTVHEHLATASRFLGYLTRGREALALDALTPSSVEGFVVRRGKKLKRTSLQHVIAHLRSFLRFLALVGQAPAGLDSQIDTPRVYRFEALPRALPWDTVCAFLGSIDRQTPMGMRDHTMFYLMATYGLRSCDIIGLTLEDTRWRQGELRVRQRKTDSPLTLPLTDTVGALLVDYLQHGRPPSRHRHLFLRSRAPDRPLRSNAVHRAFMACIERSGLEIPPQGVHCLRHSYATHLLRQGTSVKTIGDLLGHRTTESTGMYLRLALEDLRGVGLPLPRVARAAKAREVQP